MFVEFRRIAQARPAAFIRSQSISDKRKLVRGVDCGGRKKVWNDAVCSAAPTPPGRNRTLFHLRQNESLCLWLFLLSRFGVYRTRPRIHHQDLRLRGKSGVRERGDLDLDLHARIVAIAKMNKKKGKCIDKQLHRCIDRSTGRFTTARSVKCITSHQFVTRYRERTDGAEGRGEGRGKGHLAKKSAIAASVQA